MRGWRRALTYLAIGVGLSVGLLVAGLEVFYRCLLPDDPGTPQRVSLPPLVRQALLLEATGSAAEPSLPGSFPFLLGLSQQDDPALRLASTAGRAQFLRLRSLGALPERERNLHGQCRWAALSTWVARNWTPEGALETFAAGVWLGDGIYGLSDGAHHYFGLRLGDLSAAQVALLVGLIHSPNPLHPACHPERARDRRAFFLEPMLENGAVDRSTYESAIQEPLHTVAGCST